MVLSIYSISNYYLIFSPQSKFQGVLSFYLNYWVEQFVFVRNYCMNLLKKFRKVGLSFFFDWKTSSHYYLIYLNGVEGSRKRLKLLHLRWRCVFFFEQFKMRRGFMIFEGCIYQNGFVGDGVCCLVYLVMTFECVLCFFK